jgi:hypothetical protein
MKSFPYGQVLAALLSIRRRFELYFREIKRLLDQAKGKDQEEDNLFGSNKTGAELSADVRNQQERIEKL